MLTSPDYFFHAREIGRLCQTSINQQLYQAGRVGFEREKEFPRCVVQLPTRRVQTRPTYVLRAAHHFH
ncbi:hypothetical protein GBAR_LOCUS14604, partial [Geodia barretti]